MPFKEHPVFKKPANDTKIWRYMDFTKFVSLIDKRSLFFSSVKNLDDKFEGQLTRAYVDTTSVEKEELKGKILTNDEKKKLEVIRSKASDENRYYSHLTFVNSWHMNDYESAAMWKLYLKSEEGIAIQSTYQKLQACFRDCFQDVSIGMVNYTDYEKELLSWSLLNPFMPYVNKRKSFEHEKELRAFIYYFGDLKRKQRGSSTQKNNVRLIPFGLEVPINLETLIETIYVSPTAPDWFEDLVRSISKKYKLRKAVVKSSLMNNR